ARPGHSSMPGAFSPPPPSDHRLRGTSETTPAGVVRMNPILILDAIDQRDGMYGDPLAGSDPAELLVGLPLDGDRAGRDADGVREPATNRFGLGPDLRELRDDRDVHVHDLVVL